LIIKKIKKIIKKLKIKANHQSLAKIALFLISEDSNYMETDSYYKIYGIFMDKIKINN